jgi:hypothetical protein
MIVPRVSMVILSLEPAEGELPNNAKMDFTFHAKTHSVALEHF